MRAGLAHGARIRAEKAFGAVVYLPQRDRFFALDHDYAAVVNRVKLGQSVPDADYQRLVELVQTGICITDKTPSTHAFNGPSLIGAFTKFPICAEPLVVNCFATANCPLQCLYCHADDLMSADYRRGDTEDTLREVIRVADATPAMVAVVTGGEPLARLDRTERLIQTLAKTKAVVLDTSGVGDFARMLRVVQEHGVHVRVSLDSADQDLNDAVRRTNRLYVAPGISSFAHAIDAIKRCARAKVPCSVQTVVTTRNADDLKRLRGLLVDLGVTTWVLHMMVPAGKAALPVRKHLKPEPATLGALKDLVGSAAAERLPMDIRVTSTDQKPNSVLLISAKGELCVEKPTAGSKTITPLSRVLSRRDALRHFHESVDLLGHSSRYLNGVLSQHLENR
jgi:pyruvate-formate lyase-activating enzyme